MYPALSVAPPLGNKLKILPVHFSFYRLDFPQFQHVFLGCHTRKVGRRWLSVPGLP
jgi:hypothetical protein